MNHKSIKYAGIVILILILALLILRVSTGQSKAGDSTTSEKKQTGRSAPAPGGTLTQSEAEEEKAILFKTHSNKLREEAEEKKLIRQIKERKDCILNQRNIQQVMRGWQNIRSLEVGHEINWSEIIGPRGFMKKAPQCACGQPYILPKKIPPYGELSATCPEQNKAGKHEPENFSRW